MIYRRSGFLLLLLLLFAPVPILAQPSANSVAPTGEEVRTLQSTAETVNESMESRTTRLSQNMGRTSPQQEGSSDLTSVLFAFLAIAVVFEAAMSAIFDWRIFIRYFEGRGMKTPLLVGLAFWVCTEYNLDILSQILEALDKGASHSTIGRFITALLISGGSSAVFRVYSNLGIRDPAERKRKAQQERQAMADAENKASESETTEPQS